jgi:hypothetical protein
MKAKMLEALEPLVGQPIWGAGRAGDLVQLQLGERSTVTVEDEGDREVGAYSLHLSCPWRLATGERILTGSGDLWTPADAEAELESFDWETPGASWLDLRLAELWERFSAAPPSVTRVLADELGGFTLELTDGMVLEVFPESSPTGHVTTEFWRLLQPGTESPHFVVGTFGIEHDGA